MKMEAGLLLKLRPRTKGERIMRRTSRIFLAMLLGTTLSGAFLSAQTRSSPLSALDAEIETTYTVNGREIRSIGHYYRSRDGKTREDTPLGSLIIDLSRRTVTLLNPATQEAKVLTMPSDSSLLAAATESSSIAAPAASGRTMQVFEEGNLEGHRVTKRRPTVSDGNKHEVWLADDLGIVMLTETETESFKMRRVLRRLSMREPHRSLFEIPKHFRVVTEDVVPEGQSQPDQRARSPRPPGWR
jgi:hypothetical protein